MTDENTLEVFKLIVGADEVEAESEGTISEYLIERAAFYGNRLGKDHKIVKDPYSEGWVLIFMCERWF